MKSNTKGITLIALVVTIIILILLAGISINLVLGQYGIVNRAKEAKIQTEIESIKEEMLLKIMSEQANNNGDITDDKLDNILKEYDKDNRSDRINEMGERIIETEKGYVIKVLDLFGATSEEEASIANAPNDKNIAQKTYVTWTLNEEGTEYVINDTQTSKPADWYDYENGKWANIKTSNNGLEAYWVWIPRYEYIVPTSTTATEIEVKFIPTSKIKADEGYTIHPAFTNEGNGGFGELDGIWVAKFEASSNTTTPDTNYGGGDTTDLKVQIKPKVQSWRNIAVKNIFTVCRKMTNDEEVLAGSTVDSHMMKNIEWGAVAILSQSKYGIYNSQSNIEDSATGNRQIWNNPNGYNSGKIVKTGYVGDTPNALTSFSSSTAPTTVYTYETKNGTKGSTTGTVYGVYDMVGGSLEYVASALKGNLNDLEYASSKFDISNQVKPEGMLDLNFVNKYLNLYDYRTVTSNYSQYTIGDATVETKGWNNGNSDFINSTNPVFNRGRCLLQWLICKCV